MLEASGQPHHDGSALYVSTRAPRLGETVRLRLRVPRGEQPDAVFVRSTPDAEPHYDRAEATASDEHATWYEAAVRVGNPVVRYRWLLSGPAGRYRWLTGAGVAEHDVPDAHDFTLSTHPAPPDWTADALVYQIFLDRFARSGAADGRPTPAWARPADWDDAVDFRMPDVPRQFYGGDLDGVVEHLDHIAELGFNTIYLTPFFPAPSNHRYDATSFAHVDPLLGGDEALARLTAAAHARGMRVIGDLTTNHSGVTHEWFAAASAGPDAPERAFYYFRPDGSYLGWYDVRSLPKFRFGPELIGRLAAGPDSVAACWLEPPFSLDGWRIDVANMTGRHDADDQNLAVAAALRATIEAVRPGGVLIAEHCHDASADLTGSGWDGAMNYAGFLRPVWAWLRSPGYRPVPGGEQTYLGVPVPIPRLPGPAVHATVRAFAAVTPWRAVCASWSLVGSHDTPRTRTVVGDADAVGVAAGLLFTFPGTPMVFAGDELGGEGVRGEDARRPMPWGRPEAWEAVTLERYRALAHLRGGSEALKRGSLRWLAVDADALAYVRETASETLLCLATRGPHEGLRLDAHALGASEGARLGNVYGGAADLEVGGGAVSLPGGGPSFQVWKVR